jgi:hypothetical protein
MKKHRGVVWALGLCALIGLTAQESRAAGISMTLTWTGGSLSFNSLTASPYVNSSSPGGSSATALVLNLNAVNSFLTSNGSGITFNSLGASSNFPGGTPIPTQATLSENGQAVLVGGGATAITVRTEETGFTTPSGTTGTLTSLPSLSFNNVSPPGSLVSSSSYNATNTINYTSTSTGTALNPGTPPSAPTSTTIGTIVSGYTLDNSGAVDMTGSTPGSGTYTNFSVSATVTAVPEPAGLLLMLTGLPMPLVVMGLLRRRRGAA